MVSGFLYYLLTQAGLKDVPRDASGQYLLDPEIE